MKYDNLKIQFVGLKDGISNYIFKINKKFFDLFEYSELQYGNLEVEVKLEKSATMLKLNIEFKGSVEVPCDICLDNFNYQLNFKNETFIKFGEDYEVLDENLIMINRNDTEFDISILIYELIIVNLPIKKIHPLNDEGKSTCNKEILEKVNELLVYKNKSEQVEEEVEEKFDSRWNELKKLKDGTS